MKELFNEYFFVDDNGKVKEKVMLTRITVSIVLIIACLAAMTVSAYAFFTSNVTSTDNVIKLGNFEADVKIAYTDGEGKTALVDTVESEKRSRNAFLYADIDYTVTISANEEATAQTGFCVITANCNKNIYHTQQIGVDGDKTTESIVFTLRLSKDSIVNFYSHWGTSSYYDAYKNNLENEELYIVDGDTVLIEADAGSSTVNAEDNTADTTGPVNGNGYVPETSAPAQTTSPEDTTVPADTTKAPEMTTQAVTTAPEPEETTAVTEETTALPEETTAIVEETTAIPD